MRDTLMTPEELKSAKDSIAQSLPARFEHAAETVGTFAEIYVYDLPLDYYSQLPATALCSHRGTGTSGGTEVHSSRIRSPFSQSAIAQQSKAE